MAKTRLTTAAEQDVVSKKARRALCYLQRPGVAADIKRGIRRRDRHETREAIRAGRF